MFEKLKSFDAKSRHLSFEEKEALIIRLERQIAPGALPDDYRQFLLHFGASIIFDYLLVFKGINPSPWADDSLYDDIESFYGLTGFSGENTIFEAIEICKDDFKDQWIPIASSSGGNQLCLCVRGDMFGQVWFWDHEADPDFDWQTVTAGMTLSAGSITDLINRLEIAKDEPGVSGVVSCDLQF